MLGNKVPTYLYNIVYKHRRRLLLFSPKPKRQQLSKNFSKYVHFE